MNTIKKAKDLAEMRGLTLYTLAQLCGVSYSTLRSAELRNGQLSVETIELICKGIGIPLYTFFQE